MKKAIVYLLIFFVSFAYNHETIEFFAQKVESSLISWIDDFDEEEKPESKESKDKNEKSKFSDDLFLSHCLIPVYLQPGKPEYKQYINFSPSDYSQVVYSPPESV